MMTTELITLLVGIVSAPLGAWLSPEALNTLKANHGKIVFIEVQDGDEMHACYCKRPGWEALSAMTKIAKTDEVKAARTLLDNCWVGGSDAVRSDAVLSMVASGQLGGLLTSVKASLKNL